MRLAQAEALGLGCRPVNFWAMILKAELLIEVFSYALSLKGQGGRSTRVGSGSVSRLSHPISLFF